MLSLNERLNIVKNWAIHNKIEIILVAVILILIFDSILILGFNKPQKTHITKKALPVPTVKPTDTPFTTYKNPVFTKSERYDIYLIGDSMTNAFGPRGGIFNELLSKAYPGIFFEISNYAEANQSILLLPARLNESVQADHDLLLAPVLEGDPDMIIIESFGYNPLSQFGIADGLKKQEEVLTQVMTTLTNRFPDTIIMFLTAIAPDKKTYGQKINPASADERWVQAEERIEYITNHIAYALDHNIPLMNAYKESLDTRGDGDTKYINPDDNIHPSSEGLELMGKVMTEKIIEENIFPKPE